MVKQYTIKFEKAVKGKEAELYLTTEDIDKIFSAVADRAVVKGLVVYLEGKK